jgi:ABC-type lipoprotein release transport system permease subunit
MANKLNRFTLNAKRWREENGYITPEWEMYKTNVVTQYSILGLIGCVVSFVIGVII